MSDQRRLFKVDGALRPLTERQQRILDLIAAAPNGVDAPELGALLHAHAIPPRHSAHDRCEWCGQDGGRALRERAIAQRLVKSAGVYVIREQPGIVAAVSSEPSVCPMCSGELRVDGEVCSTCLGNPFYGLDAA